MSSSEIAIEISELSKCYRVFRKPADRLKQLVLPGKDRFEEHWALRDFNLNVRRGESVGVIGRNGSGKSTLLQCLAGTLQPTVGSVQVRGKVAALLELGAGFNPDFTGRENVYLSGAILGLSTTEVDERFDQIVEFSGIEEFLDQPVKNYSSGMFMRLAFSVVAHVDAEILIIDEALAVGDAFFVQKCMRFLKRFQEHGTVLFVSHDIGSVMNMCDRAVWLSDGEIVSVGDPKKVCEDYLADKYSEEMGITRRPAQRQARPVVERPVAPVEAPPSKLSSGEQVFSGLWVDPHPEGFGSGKAEICSVALVNHSTGESVDLLEGGEQVVVKIVAQCSVPMSELIIGFSIKDRLGQHLIGENSSVMSEQPDIELHAGQQVLAEFSFSMPLLLTGEYSVCAAIASGTMEQHVQHQWLHDALLFTVQSSSLGGVQVGIPMSDIRLQKLAETEAPRGS